MAKTKEANSKTQEGEKPNKKFRTRVTLDAGALPVLDQEIEKMSRGRMMIRLKRHQVLRFMVARAVRCSCGAGDRELEKVDLGLSVPVQIEADDYVASVISVERNRLADEGVHLKLSRQQMLRALIMKAARCVCPLPEWAAAK